MTRCLCPVPKHGAEPDSRSGVALFLRGLRSLRPSRSSAFATEDLPSSRGVSSPSENRGPRTAPMAVGRRCRASSALRIPTAPPLGEPSEGGRLQPDRVVWVASRGKPRRALPDSSHGYVKDSPLRRHPWCTSTPDTPPAPPKRGAHLRGHVLASCFVVGRLRSRGPRSSHCSAFCQHSSFLAHRRPGHAMPESRSVHAVSHDYDGLLRAPGAGLLHPAADHEVRLVAVHRGPARPPPCPVRASSVLPLLRACAS
jgi:hypothetical protein